MQIRGLTAAAVCALLLAGATPGDARAGDPPSAVPEGRDEGRYAFAGIPWGSSPDSVAARLVARGYKPATYEKLHLPAEGRLFDRWASIVAHFDDQRGLARWVITLPVAAQEGRDTYGLQREVYDAVIAEFEAKHGRRRVRVERYQFPYRQGDGRAARALRDGLATIHSGWGSRRERVDVEIVADLSIVLTYTSPRWDEAERARRRRKAADL